MEVFILNRLSQEASQLPDVVDGGPKCVHFTCLVLQMGNVVSQDGKAVIHLKKMSHNWKLSQMTNVNIDKCYEKCHNQNRSI